MRPQALYPERRGVKHQDRRQSGLVMARVRDLERTPDGSALTGLMTVEAVDGSVVYNATMMASHANGSSGWFWLPQEGDLVVLAFLQGHKSLPVVLGGLYATADSPPTLDPDVLEIEHQSGTKLRVEQNGDVHLAHTTGAEVDVEDDLIQLTHPSGANIRLDSTKISANNSGSNIEVDATGNIRLQFGSGPRIRVEATDIIIQDASGNNITLDATTGKVTVSVSGDIELGGTIPVVLTGDSTSGQIGGAPAHTHTVIASSVVLKGG